MGRLARDHQAKARRTRRRAIDHAILRQHHRSFREGLWRYIRGGNLATLVSTPIIYSLVIPFVLLDMWVTVYQGICFRAWGITPVRRGRYFAVDRHKLAYLNQLEKLNCLYCTYANAVVAYVREVAARTEQYWCPIRHARRIGDPHQRYAAFADYGDASQYRRRLGALRRELKR